jgi:iron(III) transport system substrate-binding protein
MGLRVILRNTLLGLAAVCASLASAQVPRDKNDAIYMYRGADRDQRLLAGARKEGSLLFYTSMATTESMPLAQAFEKKYGVKVELWRSTSDKVVQRAITEARGHRFTLDFVETNGPELEMLAREKLLSEFYSPYVSDLPAAAVPAHRLWVSDRLNVFVVAYNTNKVRRDELPKTFEGFLEAKWKGRIGLEATDAEWLGTLVKLWGQDRGMAFFRKLAEMKPDIRKGHVLFSELVAAGEVPVGLTIYSSNAESMKRRGGPIDWVPIDPVVVRPQAIGVAKNAPHPHAALLFADFILSPEGQELLLSMGRVPSSAKVKSNLSHIRYTLIDPVTVLDESEKWEKIWNDLFLKR